MKNLFVCLIAISSTLSLASEAPQMTLITKGSYRVEVPPMKCPPGAMCAPVSDLVLSLPLNGCLDSSVVTYKIENLKNAQRKFVISALNISNPKSATARCIVAPTDVKRIRIHGAFLTKESVQIEFLQSIAE